MHRKIFFYSRFGACAAVLGVLALSLAPAAQAQAPAAVSQYAAQQPSAGGGIGDTEGAVGGGQEDQGGGGQTAGVQAAGGAAGADAVDGDGESLPFTGYPLTPLIWIVFAALGLGLVVRLGAAAHQRLRLSAPPAH